jgi:integrase
MAKERTGYIYQDSKGRWYARITFTNEQGVRRDIKRSAEDEKLARKILKGLQRELENNGERFTDAANMTFAELAGYYIENYLQEAVYVGERKVSGVRARYNALLEVKPLIQHFGKRKLRSITYGDLRNFKQNYLNTRTRHGNARTLVSVNRTLSKLRRMLNIAVREQWLQRNPFNNGESLISAADEPHRTRILSRGEETRLLAAIDSKPKRTHIKGITLIALDCGLRRGEILTLTWGDVDLDGRTITVRAFNAKTAKSRTVAMTTRVYEWLSRWRENAADENIFGKLTTIKRGFGQALKHAEIFDFHFHDCRATCITRMIEAGMPHATVMRISGHSTLSCVFRYIRADNNTIFRAASALDAYLAQTAEAHTTGGELVH